MLNEKISSSMTAKATRIKKSQRSAIEKILNDLDAKFLTQEQIKFRLLSGRKSGEVGETDIVGRLDFIDAVRENARTALQFEDYRRAVRYVAALELLCRKFL